MDIDAALEWIKVYSVYITEWLFTTERVIQCSVVVAAFLIAAYISRFARTHISQPHSDTQPIRQLYYRFIRRSIFPVSFLILTGLAILIYQSLGKDHRIINTAGYLGMAWFLIRLGSILISNSTTSRIVASVIWVITALNITGYLPLVTDWLDGIKLDSSPDSLSIYDLITSTLSVAVFVWIALTLSELINRSLHNRLGLTPSAQALFSKISKFVLLAVAFLLGLNAVGIDLTAFAVFGGAIAVGIGLGLQKVFSNLIAGIILLSDNSIKPGDTIVSEGRYGKVNKLSARYISIITRDGTEHLIPNDELINHRVENWSHSDENVRLKCPVGIHFNSDVHKAIALCHAAAAETPRILKYPKPNCLMKGFGESSLNLELRFWIRDPMNGCSNVKSEVLLKIWDKFHENSIEIPYPQRDIHIRSTTGGTVFPPSTDGQ